MEAFKKIYGKIIIDSIYTTITTPKENDESSCTNALLDMATLGNTSRALSFFLYSSKGINDLGNYDECIKSKEQRFITLDFRNPFGGLAFGFCLPSECTAEYFYKYKAPLAELMSEIAVRFKGDYDIDLNLQADHVYFIDPTAEEKVVAKYGFGFVVTVSILGSFILLCCIATYMEINEKFKEEPNSKLGIVISYFGLKKSWNSLVSNPRRGDEELAFLDGFRVLGITWIIYGHVFFIAGNVPSINVESIHEVTRDPTKTFIYNATLAVDLFLYLSGFLLTYITLSRSKGSPKLSPLIFVHRIIRLYPLLLITLGVFCFIVPLINNGPIYYRIYQMAYEYCAELWPRSLTFTVNFRRWDQNCLDNTWYITLDFQLFVLSVFIVYIYSKKKLIGILIPVTIAIGSIITTIALALQYDIWASIAKYNIEYIEEYYEKPYTRAGPYMIGILAGYFFYEYKAGNLTKITNFIKNSLILNWCLYIVGVVGLIALLQALYFVNKEEPPRVFDLLYLAFSRTLFVICIFLISLPVFLGKGSCISSFFGSYPFFVLGKLTYGAYMIQQIPMNYFAYIKRKGIYFDFAHLSMQSCGYILMAYFGAFLTFLFFEQPIFALEQRFLLKKKPRKEVKIEEEIEEDSLQYNKEK